MFGLPNSHDEYTPAQVAVGTQVVMVVVEGEVKVAVVHFSVRTQASAVPHPPVGQAAAWLRAS